jgi:hypothetical protein
MARKKHKGQICARRALLQPLQRAEKPSSVEIEAPGRLAITGNNLEAVLFEQLRHAGCVTRRIGERW